MLIFLLLSFFFVTVGRCSCKYSVYLHFITKDEATTAAVLILWASIVQLVNLGSEVVHWIAIIGTRSEALDVLGIIYYTETFWD